MEARIWRWRRGGEQMEEEVGEVEEVGEEEEQEKVGGGEKGVG